MFELGTRGTRAAVGRKGSARKPRVVLVTGWTDPERKSIVEICDKILHILAPFAESLTWLATNVGGDVRLDPDVRLIGLKSRFVARRGSVSRVIPYMLLFQLKVAWSTLKLLPRADLFLFAQGSDLSVLPMLLTKLAGKKLVLRSDGRPSLVVKKYFERPGKAKVFVIGLVEKVSYMMADRILPENRELAELYEMQRYDAKTSIGSQYVDIDAFKEMKALSERSYDVGFVGRLISEKGALEFARALPQVSGEQSRRFIIIGDGNLRSEIEQVLDAGSIRDRVTMLRWVENRLLPAYLNDIKLVVVPSDYEGLSNLMLEAMACGTLVLATPVGGTPGIVREGETGYLLRDGSAECIARNIERVLNAGDLERVRRNAHSQIHKTYSYEAAVARYRGVLKLLGFEVDGETVLAGARGLGEVAETTG